MNSESPKMFGGRRWETSDQETESYRGISAFSIIAAFFGVLSPMAFFHPVLWTIPVLALIFTALTFYSLNRRPGELLGRAGAVFAMVMALISGVGAASEWGFYRFLIDREAKVFVDAWFDTLLEGRGIEAYEFQMHPLNRHLTGRSMDEQYRPESKNRELLDAFLKINEVKILLDPDLKPAYEYKGVLSHSASLIREYVTLEYEISYDEMDGRKSKRVKVTAARAQLLNEKLAGWIWDGLQVLN